MQKINPNVSNIKSVKSIDKNILKIVEIFVNNVLGKKSEVEEVNQSHDGKDGHWLETQMGIDHNRKNEPDILGYEMKNKTGSKTTFGDWSADYYLFKDSQYKISRDNFITIFGKKNEKKKGRFSWSGEPIPKINKYSTYGQILEVDEHENVIIKYSYSEDQRINKDTLIPKNLRKNSITIAKWEKNTLKKRVENKFNVKGWFICEKNPDGYYNRIVFGPPITWNMWINDVKKGLIFFDSGMYVGNNRPYSQWRANNKYWQEKLYTD